MSDARKLVWPWILALLIGLPVLYVGAYTLTVDRVQFESLLIFELPCTFDFPPVYSLTIPTIGRVSSNEEGWGRVFVPIHSMDRRLRSNYWTLTLYP